MSEAPKIRRVVAILIAVAVLAGLAWAGWWLVRRADAYFSDHNPAVAIGVLTALVCTVLIVLAIRRSGALRAAQLRCRAEAYEAVLAMIFPDSVRKVNQAERRRIRARLLLWGSRRVLEEFMALEDDVVFVDLNLPEELRRLTPLIRAMRADLGQTTFGINILGEPNEDDPDEATD